MGEYEDAKYQPQQLLWVYVTSPVKSWEDRLHHMRDRWPFAQLSATEAADDGDATRRKEPLQVPRFISHRQPRSSFVCCFCGTKMGEIYHFSSSWLCFSFGKLPFDNYIFTWPTVEGEEEEDNDDGDDRKVNEIETFYWTAATASAWLRKKRVKPQSFSHWGPATDNWSQRSIIRTLRR